MKRREFIKNTVIGFAALTAGRPHHTCAKGSMYRVAVIGRTGRGNYGHGLDVVWNDIGRAKVVAVADEDSKGRTKAAKRLNTQRAYADYRRMLEKERPQIVSVAPRWLDCHRDMVLACAERGVDVRTGVRARELILENDRVIGLRAEAEGQELFIRANKGVLLASGGYEWNNEMNKMFMNAPSLLAITPGSNEGDGHIMGMEVGAAIALMDHSIYQPAFHVDVIR